MDWRRLRLWHATLDPTNNRNHYYLFDVMGGNIGPYVDDDGDPDTLVRESVLAPTIRPGPSAPIRWRPDRAADLSLRGGSGVDGAARGSPRPGAPGKPAAHGQFDAFGNDMSKPLSSTSSFAWRGQEGSVTDRAAGLVYMQARHYDPSIGRFIQADPLALASLTTQGMNRYIYCENDPVNASDPLGFLSTLMLLFIVTSILLSPVLAWDALLWGANAELGTLCTLSFLDALRQYLAATILGAIFIGIVAALLGFVTTAIFFGFLAFTLFLVYRLVVLVDIIDSFVQAGEDDQKKFALGVDSDRTFCQLTWRGIAVCRTQGVLPVATGRRSCKNELTYSWQSALGAGLPC